ncbi:MAG: hypothetical protein H6Q78_1310 [Candidatus Krumholzibacteriota bacterium]|nr:hypothetical protein [Candidatus Krumholzibacteriota bacterium]
MIRWLKRTSMENLAWLVGAVAMIVFVPGALGGTVIDLKTVYFEQGGKEEGATIYFDTNCVRFDATEGGERLQLVFHADENGEPVCWVIDQERKSYVELNKKSVGEIEAQAERARKMFDEQLKKSPPDQREQLKRNIDAQLSAAGWNRISVEFKKIASGVKLKTWQCTQYESYVNGVKHEDVWAAAVKDIGLTEADIRTLRGMGELFSGISSETNAFFQVGRKVDQGGFEGFPVLLVRYNDGKKYEKSEVRAVRKEKLDKSVFELPQGLQERKLTQ